MVRDRGSEDGRSSLGCAAAEAVAMSRLKIAPSAPGGAVPSVHEVIRVAFVSSLGEALDLSQHFSSAISRSSKKRCDGEI